jgi:hypothetical protein
VHDEVDLRHQENCLGLMSGKETANFVQSLLGLDTLLQRSFSNAQEGV